MAHGPMGRAGQRSSVPLEAEGFKTVAAPLPLTSFSDDVAALERTLARVTGQVVLAGHAYAGAVIARHAEREGEGARLCGCSRSGRRRNGCRRFLSHRAASAGARSSRPIEHGLICLPEDGVRCGLRAARRRGGAALSWRRFSGRSRTACITVAGRTPLWKDRPTWFLVAEEDRMIVPETQRFMAARMKAQRAIARRSITRRSSPRPASSWKSSATRPCARSAAHAQARRMGGQRRSMRPTEMLR